VLRLEIIKRSDDAKGFVVLPVAGSSSAPLGESVGAPLFVDFATDEMTFVIEMVVDRGVKFRKTRKSLATVAFSSTRGRFVGIEGQNSHAPSAQADAEASIASKPKAAAPYSM